MLNSDWLILFFENDLFLELKRMISYNQVKIGEQI